MTIDRERRSRGYGLRYIDFHSRDSVTYFHTLESRPKTSLLRSKVTPAPSGHSRLPWNLLRHCPSSSYSSKTIPYQTLNSLFFDAFLPHNGPVPSFWRPTQGPREIVSKITLFVKHAGQQKRIVIKTQLPPSPAGLGQPPFLLLDARQGKVVVTHDPKGVEVGVGRHNVPHVQQ